MPSSGDFLREVSSSWLPNQTPVGVIDQVNFITDFVMSPCHASPWIYAETVFPAALEALIAFVDFDELDAVRFVARPKGLKRGRHLRGGRLRRWARKIEPLRAMQDRKYSNGVRHLWILDTTLQRVLFWVMVADIATDFIYNWASMALSTADCGPGAAGRSAHGTIVHTLGAWNAGHFGNVLYDSPTVGASGTGFSLLSNRGSIYSGFNAINTSLTDPSLLSLSHTFPTSTGTQREETQQWAGPGQSVSLTLQTQLPASGVITTELKTNGPAFSVSSGDTHCRGD